MTVKIFYLITGLFAGGAENMLKKIILKLNREMYEIIVCSLLNLTDILGDIRDKVDKIYVLNLKGIQNFPIEFFKLRRIVYQEQPQIIHCFMIHANIMGRFASLGLNSKVISSVRIKLVAKKYLNLIDTMTQRLVDVYMVNSHTLKNFVNDYGIDMRKIVLIENGIDFKIFKQINNKEAIKNSMKFPDSLIITMVAHLRKQKDYPTVLNALAHLQKEFNFTFLIVGSGNNFMDETHTIHNAIKNLNLKNVKMLGMRKDIPQILAITDIWVSSTLYEGQSNSLLEAMAMKKPIITTNIPENVEVVRDGREALLFPAKNPVKMALAIKRLIQDKDLANKIAENAYKRVLEKYDIDKTILKLEKLYSIILR